MKGTWAGMTVLLALAAWPGAAACADDENRAEFTAGVAYARDDQLAAVQPEVVVTLDLVPDRLYLDVDILAIWDVATRLPGGAETRLTGNIVPVTAAGLWALGTMAVAGDDTTGFRLIGAPAIILLSTVVQPRLRWHPVRTVGLETGWGSDWLLFHDEPGFQWRPGAGVVIRPVGTLVLEAGVQRNLWWSFEGNSGDWGWGWYVGVRFWSDPY